MDALKKKIEDAVRREGIDLIGFAPKSRFDALPAEKNPFSIFPEGETVIMLGKRICRGSLRGIEEGTNFSDYNLFGKNWLEDEFLSLACYGLTNALEDEGWEAMPLFPNPSDGSRPACRWPTGGLRRISIPTLTMPPSPAGCARFRSTASRFPKSSARASASI